MSVEVQNFDRIKREILSLCDALAQALLLSGRSNTHTSIEIVDSSLVSAFVLEGSGLSKENDKTIEHDVALLGKETFSLYATHNSASSFRVGFTIPTVYEFANSMIALSRKVDKKGSRFLQDAALYDQAMRLIDRSLDASVPLTGDELFSHITQVVSILPSDASKNNTNRLLTLVKDGAISGLGAYYSSDDYKSLRTKIIASKDDALHVLNKSRRRKIGESTQAFNFRNLIDAANLSISYWFNQVRKDTSVSFAAPFPSLRNEQSIRAMLRARTLPAALCLSLRSVEYSKSRGPEDVAQSWLVTFARRAATCAEFVRGAENISQLTDPMKSEIFLFYEDFVKPGFGQPARVLTSDETLSRARELFTSQVAFRERFEQASASLGDTADEVVKGISPILSSDEILSDFGLLDTPQVQEIMKRRL
jgi:hypothetical protein